MVHIIVKVLKSFITVKKLNIKLIGQDTIYNKVFWYTIFLIKCLYKKVINFPPPCIYLNYNFSIILGCTQDGREPGDYKEAEVCGSSTAEHAGAKQVYYSQPKQYQLHHQPNQVLNLLFENS